MKVCFLRQKGIYATHKITVPITPRQHKVSNGGSPYSLKVAASKPTSYINWPPWQDLNPQTSSSEAMRSIQLTKDVTGIDEQYLICAGAARLSLVKEPQGARQSHGVEEVRADRRHGPAWGSRLRHYLRADPAQRKS